MITFFVNYYDQLANIVTKLFSLWLLGVLLGFHTYLINLMHMIKIHQLLKMSDNVVESKQPVTIMLTNIP